MAEILPFNSRQIFSALQADGVMGIPSQAGVPQLERIFDGTSSLQLVRDGLTEIMKLQHAEVIVHSSQLAGRIITKNQTYLPTVMPEMPDAGQLMLAGSDERFLRGHVRRVTILSDHLQDGLREDAIAAMLRHTNPRLKISLASIWYSGDISSFSDGHYVSQAHLVRLHPRRQVRYGLHRHQWPNKTS